MTQPITTQEMQSRVVRFGDYTEDKAIPLMFIDSMLPGHHRLNFAVIGDTASENPDYEMMINSRTTSRLACSKPCRATVPPGTSTITSNSSCRSKASGILSGAMTPNRARR